MAETYELLIERSRAELVARTAAHDRLFHLSRAAWSVNQHAGAIVFKSPEGLTATAPVQIIGTYNTKDSTWLWGWDHPSVQPALSEDAKKLKAYGLKHQYPRLTTRKLSCTEDECWNFVALACKVCEAQGAYRGPALPALVFMTFGTIQLSKSVK